MVTRDEVRILLDGPPLQLDIAVESLKQIFNLNNLNVYYYTANTRIKFASATIVGDKPDIRLEHLQVCEANLWKLGALVSELQEENQRLKEQLEQISKPAPGDVVLGDKHRGIDHDKTIH